jgi:aminoglycoside 2'-N-acetyltransferase I
MPAAELRVAHTADLGAATRHASRALLDDVFDDMADEDTCDWREGDAW